MKTVFLNQEYRKMSRRTKKYIFTLKGLNTAKINNTYGIKIVGEDTPLTLEEDSTIPTTKLTELNTEGGTPEVISFLDESKRLHTCHVSMIDFQSRMDVNLLRYHCFWCRHPFDTLPIGCPIKYIPNYAEKRYHSHISRDIYTIKESITNKRLEELNENEQLSLRLGSYYETDGVFCSFNCCQSWINDHKHVRLYDVSSLLLKKMYNTMMDTKMIVINAAPHWRTLEQYGGHLNIMKFREGFNKVNYRCEGYAKKIPNFLPLGTLFEERIKF